MGSFKDFDKKAPPPGTVPEAAPEDLDDERSEEERRKRDTPHASAPEAKAKDRGRKRDRQPNMESER